MPSRVICPVDAAGVDGVVHAVQTPQKGRFAASRGADHGNDFVASDIERHILDGLFVTVIDVNVTAGHAGIFNERFADGVATVAIEKYPA